MSLWVCMKLRSTNNKNIASKLMYPGCVWEVEDISSPFEENVLLRKRYQIHKLVAFNLPLPP